MMPHEYSSWVIESCPPSTIKSACEKADVPRSSLAYMLGVALKWFL
jgi:hypothetical protein